MNPWTNNTPSYNAYPIPEFANNPLIEALTPLPASNVETIARLSRMPRFDPKERELPTMLRMFLPSRLSRFLFPTMQHVKFVNNLAIQIFDGYSLRNPTTPAGQQHLHHAANRSAIVPVIDPGSGRLATISMICGIPGVGKSTLVRGCMSIFGKPVIKHSTYHGLPFPETQILYLMRNVPDQCSAKAFCKSYGDYTDSLIGIPLYAKKFADKSMTRTHYVSELQKIVSSNHVGILILDCVDNLLLGSSHEVSEFVALLINIRDQMRVPVVLVGTPRAANILKADLSTSRRVADGGYIELNRPTSSEDVEFRALCKILWKYQWVQKPKTLTATVVEVLYDYSQGVTGILVSLFIACQVEAISSEKECVDIPLLRKVYNDRFKPIHRIIKILKNNNEIEMSQYGELYTKAFDELATDPLLGRVEQIKREMAEEGDRSLGIFDAPEGSPKKCVRKKNHIEEKTAHLPGTHKIPDSLL